MKVHRNLSSFDKTELDESASQLKLINSFRDN
jgi:hypothetical protein